MQSIIQAQSDDEILSCREAMGVLRPQVGRDEFLPLVRRMMGEGYCLAFIPDAEMAVCVAGYRYHMMLAHGKVLYVDDLVTLPAERSRQYGRQMVDWLCRQGRAQSCDMIHLDSGVQRFDAHRFYLKMGFRISSHHFAMDL